MLIATAGHIDHGKTALVRALTGVETDRLPQERARGISIDLGFAHWRPDDGASIGFIDVPGHERFAATMLAGVTGADFALLVVAADAGIMPQTREHLRTLDLLGFTHGAVVLTKCDRADRTQIEAVRAELAELFAPTGLHGAELFEVALNDGGGIAALQAALIAARDQEIPAQKVEHGFRLAIDRAFSVTGAGTVVTGTVLAGQFALGETLLLAPQGHALRVRGLQHAGTAAERIAAGQRCALNLAGIEPGEISRGDWLVAAGIGAPSRRITARIVLDATCRAPLRHDSRVLLHHGTACHSARILTPRQRTLAPGETAVVDLLLATSTSAVNSERLILRDASGQSLIGGGRVLDPLASGARRSPALKAATADALILADPRAALLALAAAPGLEPALGWFAACHNLLPAAAEQLASDPALVRFGPTAQRLITRERFDAVGAALIDLLARHHRDHPHLGGLARRQARSQLAMPVSAELLVAVIQHLSAADRLIARGPLLHLPDHSASFSAAEITQWHALLAGHVDQPPHAIALAVLARELRNSEAAVRALLYRRQINGDVWQVTDGKFMLRSHVAALAQSAAQLDPANSGFTAAQFRDASGLGRNFVIELLEFFDRIGVTRRIGAARTLRTDWKAVTG